MPRIFKAPPGFVLNPDYLVPELRAQRDALLEALRYWLPDETMIPAGHEAKWNEAVAAIKAAEGENT